MKNESYFEIRTMPVDLGVSGDVVYQTYSRADAEKMLALMAWQGADTSDMFIAKNDIPQWSTGRDSQGLSDNPPGIVTE